MTIYGRNGGYTTTTHPDGSQSTTLICDNFYNNTCATVTSTGPILTKGVRFNLTTFAEDGEISKTEDFENFQGIEERGDKIIIYSKQEIEHEQ